MKKGFSLVELLVVIGIIAILAGILFSSFSGGTESAKAAKCLNNMRNLAQGVISYSMGNNLKQYPPAGSYARPVRSRGNALRYKEEIGWISWDSRQDEYGTRGTREAPTSVVGLNTVSAYETQEELAKFAVTNGAIWQSVRRSHEIYICPKHRTEVADQGLTPRWSYVMNAYFGFDDSRGNTSKCQRKDFPLDNRAERTLLFAELDFSDPQTAGTKSDAILQYKLGVHGNAKRNWSVSQPESIAFNHRSGKRDKYAHVVFADGHTEKLIQNGSGLNDEELTALLCEGREINFLGKEKGYSLVEDGDLSD